MNKTQLSTLCYVRDQGNTLMLHRIKKNKDIHEGKWNGLGGKFFSGETPEECVVREVKEESGLLIKNPVLRGVLTFPSFILGEDWVVFLFEAFEFSGDLQSCDEGELHWIEDDKILSLPLWEGDPYFLQWLKEEQRFFSAKFVYKDKKLLSHHVTFYESEQLKK